MRVGANGKKQAGELLYDGKNKVEVFDGTSDRASEYNWVVVPAPDGQTENGFDAATVNSFNAQSKAKNGKPYSAHSKKNSNRFVFDVITGAGGIIPQGAVPASGITPGLCGGGGRFATGDQCSP